MAPRRRWETERLTVERIDGDVRVLAQRAPADRDEDFEAFVRARGDDLFRTVVLLCGDPAQAEDLLQAALTQAWRHWDRVTTHHDGLVRRILVDIYARWWRRPSSGGWPVDDSS